MAKTPIKKPPATKKETKTESKFVKVSLMNIKVEVDRKEKVFGKTEVTLTAPDGEKRVLTYEDLFDAVRDSTKLLLTILAGASDQVKEARERELSEMLHKMEPMGSA